MPTPRHQSVLTLVFGGLIAAVGYVFGDIGQWQNNPISLVGGLFLLLASVLCISAVIRLVWR